jgi:predicted double-glycine peptidase
MYQVLARDKHHAYAVIILLLIGVGLLPRLSWSASVQIGQPAAALRVNVPLRTLKDLRDRHLVKQTYDYSCGAAALATLLTYGLRDPVSEQEVLQLVLESLAKDEKRLRKKQGLSLLDLQQVANARGHKAQGFRLEPTYLAQLKRPVIVFIRPRGYEHFAVFRGLRGNRVYLADPSLGNIRMSRSKFLRMWLDRSGKGILFAVERRDKNWPAAYPMKLSSEDLTQPELLSARQMLEIGNPYSRFPQFSR